MTMTSITALWARTGLIYFLATMGIGLYLGLSGQFQYSSPHAHLGLLGWLSSLGFAFLHSIADPDEQLRGKARLHWAIHNVGLLVQVTSLFLVIRTGRGELGMLIGIGGLTVILGTLFFVAIVWPRLRGRPSSGA